MPREERPYLRVVYTSDNGASRVVNRLDRPLERLLRKNYDNYIAQSVPLEERCRQLLEESLMETNSSA